jgi:yeast amino acid transporter
MMAYSSEKIMETQEAAVHDRSSQEDNDVDPDTDPGLRRELKPRQVFMFSIACAIGTGLIIGSGTSLARGGPGSMLIAYLMIGATVFFVMTSLGEMAAFLPMNKGFGGYATRMVDPAFGCVFLRTRHCIMRYLTSM